MDITHQFNVNFIDLINEFNQDEQTIKSNYELFQSIKNSIFQLQDNESDKDQESNQYQNNMQVNTHLRVIDEEATEQAEQMNEEQLLKIHSLSKQNQDLQSQLNDQQQQNSTQQLQITELLHTIDLLQKETFSYKQQQEIQTQEYIKKIEQLSSQNTEQQAQIQRGSLQIQLLETTVQELQSLVDKKPQPIKQDLSQSLYQSPQVDPQLMNKVYTPASVSSYRSDQVPKTPDERKKLFRDLNRNATLSASMMSVKHDYTTLQQIIRSNDNLSTKSDKSEQ